MTSSEKVKSGVEYGRALVNSGLTGLRNGCDSHLQGQPLSDALSKSARGALGLAAIGTCAALMGSCFSDRTHRRVRTIGFGVVGSVIGLAVGLAWKTRDLTASMGRSALKEMGVTRDQHWLQKHPIDYA
jgi:hypothetical protein